jgi:hypothetical protein
MKDNAILLLTGVVCSLGAWAFWHYLGDDAAVALVSVAALSVAADNVRLRRKLKQLER